jgi:hypothetical protein
MVHLFLFFCIYVKIHIDKDMGRGKRKYIGRDSENMQTDENTKREKRQRK